MSADQDAHPDPAGATASATEVDGIVSCRMWSTGWRPPVDTVRGTADERSRVSEHPMQHRVNRATGARHSCRGEPSIRRQGLDPVLRRLGDSR